MQTPTVTTTAEIINLINELEAEGEVLYVRSSKGPNRDQIIGVSTNHSTGEQEIGLSVWNIKWNDNLDPHDIASAVLEHRRFSPHEVTYLLTGTVIGTGSDGEPLLDPDAWIAEAIVDANAIAAEDDGAVICEVCGDTVYERNCTTCGTEAA